MMPKTRPEDLRPKLLLIVLVFGSAGVAEAQLNHVEVFGASNANADHSWTHVLPQELSKRGLLTADFSLGKEWTSFRGTLSIRANQFIEDCSSDETCKIDDSLIVVSFDGFDFDSSFLGTGKDVYDDWVDIIERFVDAGAKNIVTSTMPDFATLPVSGPWSLAAREDWFSPKVREFGRLLVEGQKSGRLAEIAAARGAHISVFDELTVVDHLVDDCQANPGTCPVATVVAAHPEGLFALDGDVHFTPTANRFLGEEALSVFLPGTEFAVGGYGRIGSVDTLDEIDARASATASQSSDATLASVAALAIDGDPSSVAATNRSDAAPWWEVEFSQATQVARIRIHSRQASLTGGGGFRAEILDSTGATIWSDEFAGNVYENVFEIALESSLQGDRLRLAKLDTTRSIPFALGEVEVFSNAAIYSLDSEFTWAFDLNSVNGTSDALIVENQLDLNGGRLSLSILEGEPKLGDEFTLFYAGSISGSLSHVDLPSIASTLQWDLSHLSVAGRLFVASVGDATGDGLVDLEDFSALKDEFGTIGIVGLAADFDDDFDVDLGDFVLLKRSFESSPAAVPEPSTAMASLLCVAMACCFRQFLPRGLCDR